ncbi:MAG: methyl-accepting chemotaxis protein [Muribaculaceae bacterium]|nr:methyl-accepting chemotaxis protein [Roseburia sp.]MCM1430321.1 methyl-accepting chemotaxis protein [Muribaculaceae bacterium]MCM1492483.1 methyl-accepting chemotaxis protein [Muribaculaceae bacterium]
MKQKKRISTRLIILIPVIILGLVSIISNLGSFTSIRKVNANATQITDESMESVTRLAEIEQQTQQIHILGLSHIVATDLNTMISLVDSIRSVQASLEQDLAEYQKFVGEDTSVYYDGIVTNYEGLKYETANLLAFSAAGDSEAAYALANGAISEYSGAIDQNIGSIRELVDQNVASQRASLSTAYMTSLFIGGIVILISVAALIAAAVSVLRLVIMPLSKTQKEISDIITDIDNHEGDLTRRVTIMANREVAEVGSGINVFMEKLQEIFKIIIANSSKMEAVVNEVRESVQTSNGSVSDLSALTEQLSATMQDMSENASLINTNTESVASEVNEIAEKSSELNQYTKEMKAHAESMESSARQNMESTSSKVNDILTVLEQAIEDSKSVNQVNSLTDDILNIASQTNLLALNASIEAARAGDAGRGFAVVATEISQLATASQEAANNIQRINAVVTDAVHNLADNANGLVSYMNDTILPEFQSFVESGEEYRNKASFIEDVMNEFRQRTDVLKNSMNEIANSVNTISHAIEEGVNGVVSTADSTQLLVEDMDNISHRMDENLTIASDLKKETAIFTKL